LQAQSSRLQSCVDNKENGLLGPGRHPKLKAVEDRRVLVASDTRSMTQQGTQTNSFAAL